MGALELIASVLGTGALAVAGAGAYHALLSGWQRLEAVRTDVARQRNERRQLELSLETGHLNLARQQWNLERDKVDRARVLSDGARFVMLDSKTVLDLLLGALYSVSDGLLNVSPAVAVPEQRRRQIEAMAGLGAPAARAAIEAEPDGGGQPWPGVVNLGRHASIHDLVIGATQDGKPVTLSLHDLMHCLLAGASGWGKSVWLRSFVYQLARAPEPVEAIAIDVSGSELNALYRWPKLRYPVAKNADDAVLLLGEVVKELEHRQELFAKYPLATNINEYNGDAAEPLTPWVILADEGTALLGDNKSVAGAMKAVLWRARQYGIYAIVAGQTARYDVIPTPLRDQFSTRLAFRLSPTSSRVVLDDRSAADLRVKGRCVAVLTGQEPQELQGPFVSRQQFVEALAGGGPKMPMPEPEPDPQVELIRELAEQGLSDTAIALQVYGFKNGDMVAKVRQIRNNGMGDG